jgi:hypothetical protein
MLWLHSFLVQSSVYGPLARGADFEVEQVFKLPGTRFLDSA